MSLFDFPILDVLASLGVAKVEVEFSGGGDEGGVDAYRYYNAEGHQMEDPIKAAAVYLAAPHLDPLKWGEQELPSSYGTVGRVYDPSRGENELLLMYLRRFLSAPLAQIEDALAAPVDDRYGSFAGEFYVSGTVTWGVNKKDFEFDAREEDPDYDEEREDEW